MYRDALTAVEQSQINDSTEWCEATDENIDNLRRWATDAARTCGSCFGETHHHDRWMFRGWDYDQDGNKCDWCVAIEIEPPQDGEDD